MRRRLASTALLACAVALAGCFQFKTLVRLEADGSGTIEETLLFSDFVISMALGDSTQALYDEAELRARADSLGAGVRLVRVDSLAEGGFRGYRAVYAFRDVNTVRVRPEDGMAAGADGGTDGGAGDVVPTLTFAYEPPMPGAPGRLRIRIPRPGEAGSERPLDPDSVAALAEEVRQGVADAALFRDMLDEARFAVQVVLPSPPAETNARFVESGMVTIADFALESYFDLMAENPELAARLQLAETAEDREAALAALNAREGLRFEPEEEVVVTLGE